MAKAHADADEAVDGREAKGPPQSVLLDAVLRAVGDAELLGALFTTYSIDPGFFQDEVLSRLIGQESTMIRARRLLARDALGEVRPLVLYDAETVQGGQPIEGFRSDLPVHYIGVNHPTGAFHPKLCLLLTGPLPGSGTDTNTANTLAVLPHRLVVVVASANLTASGWRRNVEVAWTGVVERSQPCPFRDDLLGTADNSAAPEPGMLERLRTWCGPAGNETLDAMLDVVRASTVSKVALPRLWHGQTPLDRFLRHHLPEKKATRRVELVAPFASDPNPAPLKKLIAASQANQTTVRVPQDREGGPSVSEQWVKAVGRVGGVRWGELPETVTTTGSGRAASRATARYVHAKLLHLVEGTKPRRAWVLSGSPNLTVRGHAGVGPSASNVEIAVLAEERGGPRAWLEPAAKPKGVQSRVDPPEEPPVSTFAGVYLVVDWERRSLSVRVEAAPATRVRIYAAPGDDNALASAKLDGEGHLTLTGTRVEPLLRLLEHQSVLWAQVPGFDREAVLVQERGLLEKPDALSRELTPADILSIWATLEPFRRQRLLEEALKRSAPTSEGEADVYDPGNRQARAHGSLNLFERQAGQFFAFHIFKERLRRCFEQGRPKRAEVMVFGSAGDSVRSLAKRVLAMEDDAVERLVLLLCCRELLEEVGRADAELLDRHRNLVDEIDQLLEQCWAELETDDADHATLREWVLSSWPGLST